MKKIFLPLIIAAVLLSTLVLPQYGEAASSLEEINKRLADLEKKQKALEKDKLDKEREIVSIRKKEKTVAKEINYLNNEIDKTLKAIDQKEQDIAGKIAELKITAADLDAAEKRVEERDALLRSRLRLMYTNGAVSYLDVLFSATSFADFLDRYRSLTMIVDQDKDILEANIKDKNLIAETKKKIETDLSALEQDYKDLEDQKKSLQKKEKDKEVMIAQLHDRKADLEDVTEEQEKALTHFASEKSKLLAEKTKLTAKKHKGKFAWPLPQNYPITSQFGYRIHPISKKKKLHTGTDIGAPRGTKILAAGSGVVLTAKYWGGYGNAVIIDHLNGYWTVYAHMSRIRVKEEQTVKTGDYIGDVGSTGSSTGPHLHFEVRINSEPVDAMKYTTH